MFEFKRFHLIGDVIVISIDYEEWFLHSHSAAGFVFVGVCPNYNYFTLSSKRNGDKMFRFMLH